MNEDQGHAEVGSSTQLGLLNKLTQIFFYL